MSLQRQIAEFDSSGIRAHVAAIVCRCGWLACETPGGVYYCENSLCRLNLRPFRIELMVNPLQERGVN